MTKRTRNFMLVSGAILIIGLGTGLVASYFGLPVSLLSNAAGPDELQYVPQNAAVVAYANVREVMNSEFRERFRKLEPQSAERNEFEEKTGVKIDQDIDSIVAAFIPSEAMTERHDKSAVVLARGRFEVSRLEVACPRARRAPPRTTRASACSATIRAPRRKAPWPSALWSRTSSPSAASRPSSWRLTPAPTTAMSCRTTS